MADTGEAKVRGRCGCGRRYRILHAQPDQVVTCPNCGRSIIVTRADLKAAGAGEMLVPLQPEQVVLREALLVDEVELRPAPAGSGPGLTGRQVHTHEVALLAEALEPSRQIVHGAGAYSPGAPRSQPAAGAPVRPAAFLLDMLASFWFAGRPRNALVLAITALVFTVPLLILGRPVIGYVVFLLTALLEFLLFLHALQFFWHVMTETAMGEDDLPVVPRGWDWIEDALKPLGWLLLITLLCSVPAIAAVWYAPPGQYREPLIWAAVLLGTFVWPIALLSVALANGRVLLRPDLLVRSVWGIGPAYIAAWFLVLALVAAIVIFVGVGPAAMGWPAVVATVYPIATGAMVFYLAYVLFRTLGLLFRHFGGRLPWRV